MRYTPTDITSTYAAITALNANFDDIATLLEKCVFTDGTAPNQMEAGLNMNHFKVQNLGAPVNPNDAVRLVDLEASIPTLKLSVVDFGADPLGVLDSTAAFNDAATHGIPIYVPTGTYKVSSLNVIDRDGFYLYGDGPDASIITTTSATANVISIGAGVTLRNSAIIRDLTITSSVTKTAGYAIALNKTFNVKLYNVKAVSCFGLVDLLACQLTTIRDCVCLTHTPTTGKAISARSDGTSSNLILNNVAVDGGIGTQPLAGLYVEEWDGIFMADCQFNRTGTGLIVTPAATKQMTHMFCDNSSFDSCSSNGVSYPNGGGSVVRQTFSNSWIGTNTNSGVNVAVGSSLSGLRFNMCRIVNNGSYGINALAPISGLQVVGGLISGNGTTTSNTYSGIFISNGGTWTNLMLANVQIGPAEGLPGVQKYALEVQTATGPIFTNAIVIGCNLAGNGTGSINLASSSYAGSIIRDNQGFVTENGGTATVTSGATSIVVTHGCGRTPLISDIVVTPTSTLGSAVRFWISTVTSTQFTINVDVAPGGSGASFAWMTRLL